MSNTNDKLILKLFSEIKKILKSKANKLFLIEAAVIVCSMLFWIWAYKKGCSLGVNIASTIFITILVTLLGQLLTKIYESKEKDLTERFGDAISKQSETISGMQEKLDCLIKEQSDIIKIFKGKKCLFCRNNISDISMKREKNKVSKLIKSATKSISILATNLESFQDCTDELKEKAQNGITVRVATLNPESKYTRDFINTRHIHENSCDETICLMKGALERFFIKSQSVSENDKFQIKVYEGIAPSIVMIIIDSEKRSRSCKCIIGYLLNHIRSSETIHFTFSRSKYDAEISPVDKFIEHFESIWNQDECVKNVDNIFIKKMRNET